MWNRCGTDHLFHYLATATGKDKTGTDGTDDLLKKRTEKEIEGGGVKNCTSTTVCMSFSGHNNGEFQCSICSTYRVLSAPQ
jgi:hypothetical protein